jgi:(p)ppGpp synthase/HD superfamily hydrolase
MAASTSTAGLVRTGRTERFGDRQTLKSAWRERRSERKPLGVHGWASQRVEMADLECQLEDRAFKQLMPRQYKAVARLVRRKRAEREQYTRESVALLEEALDDAGVDGIVYGRTKNLYSTYRKLKRYHACGRNFRDIYDLTALRVVVGSVGDCYSALGVVHGLWQPVPGEFDDYIANPKENHYQSLHTSVIGSEGYPLEVQIRTKAMHRIAEDGAAAHRRYKRTKSVRWASGA